MDDEILWWGGPQWKRDVCKRKYDERKESDDDRN